MLNVVVQYLYMSVIVVGHEILFFFLPLASSSAADAMSEQNPTDGVACGNNSTGDWDRRD